MDSNCLKVNIAARRHISYFQNSCFSLDTRLLGTLVLRVLASKFALILEKSSMSPFQKKRRGNLYPESTMLAYQEGNRSIFCATSLGRFVAAV